MPARKTKASRRSPHDDFELPAEIDFSRTQFVGMGLESLDQRPRQRVKRTVELDLENDREFPTGRDINEALRLMKQIRDSVRPSKRRKSA
jgi:hypothetical protein